MLRRGTETRKIATARVRHAASRERDEPPMVRAERGWNGLVVQKMNSRDNRCC